jgi:hypothetical protein
MATERHRPELVGSAENIVITPDTLLKDNHTETADKLRAEWMENKRAGELYVLDACGDARVRFPRPEEYVTLKSIAAGGLIESVIVSNAGTKFAVVASHFDGETFVPGQMPTGCGGLGAKDKALKEKKPTPIKGIGYYIENNIEHPDPLIKALLTANRIAKETGKPCLAVAQDHRTSKIYPFGVFLPGKAPICAINLIDQLLGYNPKEMYGNGIPELENSSIPDIFMEFIDACKAQMKELLVNFPNLTEMLRVQNPRMIVLSTEIMSAKIRYPEIAGFPGILFKLHLPRIKNGTEVSIDPGKLEDVVNQTEYPIQHAVDNFEKPNEPFSKTDRILIETENIDLSRKVALRLAEEEWMGNWLALPEHQMLIAQTQEGITQLIEQFTLQTA